MNKSSIILLTLLTPFLLFFISLRLAFTEPFLEVVYAITKFPDDGIAKEEKLKIAKIGFNAVLSEQGMREFMNCGLFNQREVTHMQDVRALLSTLFGIGYLITGVFILLTLIIRDSIQIARALFFGSVATEAVLILAFSVIYIFFDKAFEIFHLIFFDPYSWRFYPGDTLIYVYPIQFWRNAFIFFFLLFMLVIHIVFLGSVTFLAKKKALPFRSNPRTLDK